MKKLYSLIAVLLFTVVITAQVQVSVQSPGVYRIVYGASNDYTVYEPGFAQTFYVHVWIQANQNSANTLFEDLWSNSNVTMDWDDNEVAYVGTVDLNTKSFTATNNTLPGNTTVTQLNFVFKDLQNGHNKQSPDLFTTLTTTTLGNLGVLEASGAKSKSFVSEGFLYTDKKGDFEISVFDMSGRQVKIQKVHADRYPVKLDIPQKGNYILTISGKNVQESIKFRY
ncbi:T9SS type A sorting domain-containing protein [Chryseobacterium sp. NRRL B-14859]|uniref:T9SS type A sorting domain-containing protein n=1 Tax=Chryseobacterium sp. NRRL B-14859 TaxID=1562763 RepID=UPI003396771B